MAKKPVNSHATVPEESNAGIDNSDMEKARKGGVPGVNPFAAKPAAAAKPATPKKPFAGAVRPFTPAEGENPPPMAKKPGKQDNNISSKIPMAPAGAYPNQLPSFPVRNPKKPPVPPVQAGTPGMMDDQNKKKGSKKK